MPWFKVDDKFHSHRKVAKAGTAAVGLWVECGSWAADQLTDGFVPDYIARRFDEDADEHAARLVAAGLWEPGERDDDVGWYFHDWAEHQPTRDQVEAKREYEREKKRAQRRSPEGRFAESPAPSPRDSTGTDPRTSEGVQPTRPDPTRPDPSRTSSRSQSAPKGTRIPDDFQVDEAMQAWAAEKNLTLDISAETERFIDYWRGRPGSASLKADWPGTWRNWMRRASEDRRRTPGANGDDWMNRVSHGRHDVVNPDGRVSEEDSWDV